MALHCRRAFHQLAENVSLRHQHILRDLLGRSRLAARAANSPSIAVFRAFFSFGFRSDASSLFKSRHQPYLMIRLEVVIDNSQPTSATLTAPRIRPAQLSMAAGAGH